jgi:hypothetical protein
LRIGPKPPTHRRNHLTQQGVVGLDRIAELGVAHYHQPGTGPGDDCRGRRTSIQHADLAEEVPGSERAAVAAIDIDVSLSLEQ